MAEGQATESKQDYSFGQLAIRESLATFDQVKECLDIQAKLRAIGLEPKKLGDILIEKGYLTLDKAQHILKLQASAPAPAQKFQIPGYEILAKIGAGAMGSVFKARQVSMDRIVAIKVLAPKYSKDNAYVQRFLHEARAVARLNHENVISGIDVGDISGVHYFVMEYVEGTSVANILKKQGTIDEKRCLQIALQVARALEHAHRNKMVHRDVKPENVLITTDGTAKLCDLGLAKQVSGGDASLTMDGMSVGTPNYISPEQARGEDNIDIRTDLYSLGASIYHMATGQVMFDGPNPMAVMTKHVTDPVVPPKQRMAGLTEGFNALVLKMVMKHRQDRYQSPTDVINDIEKLLRGESVQNVPSPVPAKDGRHPGRSSQLNKAPGQTPVSIPRPHLAAAAQRRPPSMAPFIVIGVIVAGAILAFVMFGSGGGAKPPVNPNGTNTNPTTSPVDPKAADAEAQKTHDERLSAFRSIRDRLLSEKDGTMLTEPFSRLDSNIEYFKNSRFEEEWRDEKKKFTDEMNARIEAAEWGRLKKEADELRKQGKIAEAVAHVEKLGEVYRFFRKSEPRVFTLAGTELRDFREACRKQLDDLWTADRMKAMKLIGEGKTDDALALCDEMSRYAGEERRGDVDSMRHSAISRELDALLKDPLTQERVNQAMARLDDFVKRFPSPGLIDYASRKKEDASRRLADSLKTAIESASNVYKVEFQAKIRSAMDARDLAGVRKELFSICLDAKYAAAQPALLLNAGDGPALRMWLTTTGPHDYKKLWALADEGYKTALRTGNREAARELYLDIRAAVLLDEILDQAARGADLLAKDRSVSRTGLSAWLVQATEAKVLPRGEKVALDVTTRSGAQKVVLSPTGGVGEVVATEDDIVAMARRSYATGSDYAANAEKDPLFHVRAMVLQFHANDLQAAKDEYSKIAEASRPVALERYTGAFKGVATQKEDDTARKRYTEAVNLWLANKKKEAVVIFKELLESYDHTPYMKEKLRNGKTRIEAATGWVIEVDGKAPDPKEPKDPPKDPKDPPPKPKFEGMKSLFPHAKSVTDRKNGKFEITYDFDAPEAINDFTKEGFGMGNGGTWEIKDKVLEGEGSILLYWNPVLKGDYAGEFVVRAKDTKNLGFIVHGNGGFSGGTGYVAWLKFSNESGVGPKQVYMYDHPITKMPWNAQTFRSAYIGTDTGKFTVQKDAKYTVRVLRRGKAVDVAVGTAQVSSGENGDVNEGRAGFAVFGSSFAVESAKFTGEFEPKWYAEAEKKGSSGGLDAVDPKDGPPKKPADK